ncbi:MAG: PAS domain S-box protein [Chloroflexi bacterium]|nr:PAS domain S-box protein [Chloroflexota bacterium]
MSTAGLAATRKRTAQARDDAAGTLGLTARALLDRLSCAVWLRDVNGELIFLNSAGARLLGIPSDQLPGLAGSRDWIVRNAEGELLAPDEMPSVVAARTRSAQLGHLTCTDDGSGAVRWLLGDSIPLPARDGGGVQVLTTAVDVTPLKRGKTLAPASDDALRRMLEATHEGVCMLDGESRITYVNRRLADRLGYGREDLIGKPSFTVFEPDDEAGADTFPRDVERAVALRCKDGSRAWATVNAAPLATSGEPSGMLALFRDVTDRRMSANALRRSEARFRALIENAVDAVAIVDRHGRLSYASPSMARLAKVDIQSRMGHDVFERLEAIEAERLRQTFAILRKQPGATKPFTSRFKDSEGQWHYIEGLATNLLEDPNVGGIVVNVRDVSERRLAEERALAAANLIEQLTEDAILIADPDGKVRSWNRGAERLFGWTKEEVIGKPSPVVPGDYKSTSQVILKRVVAEGETLTTETERITKSGERIPVLGSWSPVPLEDGRIGVLSILKDLRDQREKDRQLREQAQSLTLLRERQRIAMDLHDGVIQSLFGVTLSLGAARRQAAENGDSDAAPAGLLGEAIGQLTETIENIREYIFDLRTGAQDEGNLEIGLRTLVDQARANSGIDVRLTVRMDTAMISYNTAVNLLHIAREAVSNVTRHANARNVSIAIESIEKGAEMTITDDGRGFDTSRRGRRLGDGLRNMRERARLIGAALKIESKPGNGATVRVRFRP